MAYLQGPVLQWFLWKTDYGSTLSGFRMQINAFLSLSLFLSSVFGPICTTVVNENTAI